MKRVNGELVKEKESCSRPLPCRVRSHGRSKEPNKVCSFLLLGEDGTGSFCPALPPCAVSHAAPLLPLSGSLLSLTLLILLLKRIEGLNLNQLGSNQGRWQTKSPNFYHGKFGIAQTN